MVSTAKVIIGDSFLPLLNGTIKDQFVLCEGPRGTAKTRSILSILLSRALACPGSRWLLARSTRTRLTETVLVTLEKQVFPAFGMSVPGGAGRDNRHSYDLPNGSILIPMGLDDPQRSQSAEFAGIYVAEGVEISKLDDVTALAGSMRQAVPVHHQCIVDCNPGPPGHWLNQIAEPIPKEWRRAGKYEDYKRLLIHAKQPAPPGKWKRIVTRHQDNPGYFDVKAWKWTELGEQYLATLGYLTGHLRRRWLDGDWVSAEGTVYPQFDDSKHVVTPFAVPHDWPVFVFYDPGYDHPCCVLWIAVAPNGCLYIIDEIYGSGIAPADLNRMIHQRNAGRNIKRYYGDPQYIFSKTQMSPKSLAQQFKEFPYPMTFMGWPRTGGNEETMVEAVRTKLIDMMLKVFSTCTNCVSEFQSWSYKRTATGELPAGEDKFEDKDNHAMDCVKGGVACNLKYAPSKVEVV